MEKTNRYSGQIEDDRTGGLRMQSPYLNTNQAADYLQLKASTLENYRVYGGGPVFYQRGRLVRYLARDLDCWLTSARFENTAQAKQQKRAAS